MVFFAEIPMLRVETSPSQGRVAGPSSLAHFSVTSEKSLPLTPYQQPLALQQTLWEEARPENSDALHTMRCWCDTRFQNERSQRKSHAPWSLRHVSAFFAFQFLFGKYENRN